MNSRVAECGKCGRLYHTLVNTSCPACSTGTVPADETKHAVEGESDEAGASKQ